MNLLISESLPVDVVLDRAIPWMDDVMTYLTSWASDDEPVEYESHDTAGESAAWYELRLSTLRQVIMDPY
jgi:hypothetical protein